MYHVACHMTGETGAGCSLIRKQTLRGNEDVGMNYG